MLDDKAIAVGVIGSRTFSDYEYMKDILQWYNIKKIISGGANGADNLAQKYAIDNNIPCKIYPAEWKKYGKSAGYQRNILIVKASDEIIAFWNKKSLGTKLCIDIAHKQSKPVHVYWPDPKEDDDDWLYLPAK
jgi:hypothetical protein